MRYAIVADAHITDTPDTPKCQALAWCADRIRALRPDGIVLLGDMTATGGMQQCQAVLAAFEDMGVPVYSTLGNAEYRDRHDACLQALTIDAPQPLVLVNSANYELSAEDMARLQSLPAGANCLLATHIHYDRWPEAAQAVLREARERRAVTAFIAGHIHEDGAETMRGIDPDKASGGVPAFELWEQTADGAWRRSREEMPGVAPADWTADERERFLRNLGVSCMYDSLKNLRAATECGIQALELRETAVMKCDIHELQAALAAWRAVSTGPLSFHMPVLTPQADQSRLSAAADMAIRLGCNRVTLHVPAVTATQFPQVKTALLENFKRCLNPLLEHGIAIGIENLHTKPPKVVSDDVRNYGCTIAECRDWIEELREMMHSELIGFHLDIGHARNNAPFSGTENLSDYYTRMGHLVNGMHLHQVLSNHDGTISNHHRLNTFYGKLISLSGLFLAFRRGLFAPDVPMYLEISEDDAGIECWQALKQKLFA